MWKVIFLQNMAFWLLTRKLIARLDYQFLSSSALAIMTLQLSTCFTHVAFWWVASCESLSRSSRENPLNVHTLEFFTLFSHTTLTLFPPKYRVSNYWNTRELAQNKANTWLNKFNLIKTFHVCSISIVSIGLVFPILC